jgi:NAD-dependent deacetylase
MSAPEARLAELLDAAHQIVFFTGAGVSTGSGIADYRGPQGQWKTKEPVYFQDFMASEAARREYWEQKLETWPEISGARPNAAHRAIVDLERAGKVLAVVTQNIDGLHEKAGTACERLVEVHGTNLKVECMSCHELSEPGEHFKRFAVLRQPPSCARCGGYLKPATISFGQGLDEQTMRRAMEAAMTTDLAVALGSSLSVQPAASFPLVAAQRGVPYVIVNRGVTEHDALGAVTLRIDADVTEVLPRAVAACLGG